MRKRVKPARLSSSLCINRPLSDQTVIFLRDYQFKVKYVIEPLDALVDHNIRMALVREAFSIARYREWDDSSHISTAMPHVKMPLESAKLLLSNATQYEIKLEE